MHEGFRQQHEISIQDKNKFHVVTFLSGISSTDLTYFPTKTDSYNLVYKIFAAMYFMGASLVDEDGSVK